ncbi:family 43 glycosylhydrolase [Terribacillus saccharophilus]|uniref:family 43 glycosylhydrolase n=1 Tax=Terribacillus saccharophilus TaxID=361277 RepID=UPI003982844A
MSKQAVNPILPSYEYIPDTEPRVFGDRVYLYGSHDRFNGTEYCMNSYVSWSAPVDDLTDWRYEGEILEKGLDPLDPEGELMYYAPDAIQGKDQRYYLYYAIKNLSIISVAVCDTPSGKYEFLGHIAYPDGKVLGSEPNDAFQFDPSIFIDDDGRIFLYSGFNPPKSTIFNRKIVGAMVMELEDDMVTLKHGPKVIIGKKQNGFKKHEFFEAPSMRKVNGTYYLIYSSFPNTSWLCYATSQHPDKGFKYKGIIVANNDVFEDSPERKRPQNYSGNNHGGIVEIRGKWYVFYHRNTNRHGFSRQACAEKIHFNEDGLIPQVEITSCGLNDGPLAAKGEYSASIACNLKGKRGIGILRTMFDKKLPYITQDGEDRNHTPFQYITNIWDGALIGYKYFSFTEEISQFSITTRGAGEGVLLISSTPGGKPLAKIQVSNSAEWQKVTSPFQSPQQEHALYITFQGKGAIDIASFSFDL